MQKTTLYLDPETALAIRRIAATAKRSQADVIREALVEYTVRAQPAAPRGIGAYASGRTDTGESAEELLRRAARTRKWA